MSVQVLQGILPLVSGQQERQDEVLSADLSHSWGLLGRRPEQWRGDTSLMNDLAPAALNLLFLSAVSIFMVLLSATALSHLKSDHVSHNVGSQNFNEAKPHKGTSLRCKFCRINMESFVAISRSWLIYRKCKWNNPLGKTALNTLDPRCIIHLFELSCWLFWIGDDSGAIIHQETSALTLSWFFFFLFSCLSPSIHMANEIWEVICWFLPAISYLSSWWWWWSHYLDWSIGIK